jgi:guanylate kinase
LSQATEDIALPSQFRDAPPLLVVVSGPSGVGKDTALRRMREMNYPFHFLVTNTTRPKRPDEKEDIDYHFITEERFARMERDGEFLEHAVVYGYHYGNSRSEVRAALARGQDVIMRIDVQGAATIKRHVPEAVFIFLLPPSFEQLEARLLKRHTEPEEYLRLRLHAARLEMNELDKFDYRIINEDDALDETAELIYAIIRAEKCRVKPRRVVV